jgi:hypothetical protein
VKGRKQQSPGFRIKVGILFQDMALEAKLPGLFCLLKTDDGAWLKQNGYLR